MDTASAVLENLKSSLSQTAGELFEEEIDHYATTRHETFDASGKIKTKIFGTINRKEYEWLNTNLKKRGYPPPHELWGVPAEMFITTTSVGTGRTAGVQETRDTRVYEFINHFWKYRGKPFHYPLN